MPDAILISAVPKVSVVRGMVHVAHDNGRTLAVHPHDFLVFLKEGERVMAGFLAQERKGPAKIGRRRHG